jgi:hypothetical protein
MASVDPIWSTNNYRYENSYNTIQEWEASSAGNLLSQHSHQVFSPHTHQPAGSIVYHDDQLGISDGSGIKWIDPMANQPYGYNTDLIKMREMILALAKIIKPHVMDEAMALTLEQLQLALGDYSVAPEVEPEKYLDNELFEL